MRVSNCFFILVLFLVGSCYSSKKVNSEQSSGISGLRFINEYIVPNNLEFKGTVVGGLSGIDYDKKRDLYYLVSDDPSAKSPTRFYTAKLLISENGIDSVVFTDVTYILNREGNTYPGISKDLLHSADLEAMRFEPGSDLFIRTSEGQRRTSDERAELQNPDIVIMDRNGKWKDSFALPANMHVSAVER